MNHLLPTKQELYNEFFNVTEDTKAAVAETEQEKLDRIRQREKNRKTFHKYLRDKVPDKLACALLLTADIVDTKAFNAKRYRPEIDRKGLVAGLVSLGVDATEAENMAEYISTFPLPCKEVIKRVCVLSCQECNQHELFDGTRLKGFLPTRTTVGLKLADWSDWKQANERYGDRRGLGKQYLRNMCQRCDTKRQVIHHRSNEKKKNSRSRMLKEIQENTPHLLNARARTKEVEALIAHCSVHAMPDEEEMWHKFARLSQVSCMIHLHMCDGVMQVSHIYVHVRV